MAVSRPTVGDLVGWLKLNGVPDDPTLAVYTEAMDAALDYVESRIDLPAGWSNTNYPQRVRTAILMAAARLAKRSTTPEGVAGFGGDGIVIRLLKFDPDVEMLLSRYLKISGFA